MRALVMRNAPCGKHDLCPVTPVTRPALACCRTDRCLETTVYCGMTPSIPPGRPEPIVNVSPAPQEDLGEMLVRLGYLTPAEHEIVRKARRNRDAPTAKLPLGEILVAAGHVSEDQVAEALDRMRVTGRRFGEELVAAGYLSHEHVALALRLQRWIVAAALIAAMVPANPGLIGSSEAAEARASMQVSAMVVQSAYFRQITQSGRLDITAQDIRNGFVEVPAASQIEIQSEAGTVFEFHPVGSLFDSVTIRGIDATVSFGPGGGVAIQKGASGGASTITIGYRFELARGVTPGTYDWPLTLTLLPL